MPVAVVFLIILLNMTAYRGAKVAVSLFAIDLGATPVAIGALAAMFSVFPMLLALYAGKLTDRLGVRVPMIAGSLGVAVGSLVPFAVAHTAALYVSAILIGASWVFYNVCAQNLVGILSDPAARAKNFSNYGLVMAGGSFFGPMVAGFSIDHIGHQNTYLVLAGIPLVSVLMLAALRNVPAGNAKLAADEHAAYSAHLLKNVPLRHTLVTSAIILTGTDLFQFYMPIYGREIGLSASAIGVILGTFAVAAFVVRLVMPALVRRHTPDTVLVMSLYIGAASYVVFPFFGSAVTLAAVAFVLGLGMGCSQPVSLMLIYERAPPGRSGEALGLRLAINNFMHIAVPMFFGSIGTVFGLIPVFLANAAILATGGVLSGRAKSALVAAQVPKTGSL